MKCLLNCLAIVLFSFSFSGSAQALASFTRQTGMACTACHTQAFGPNLNPYGRDFKLHGYTWGNNGSLLSRFGGSLQGSFTNTQKNDPKFTPSDPNYDPNYGSRRFNANNNLAFDQAAINYGGKILGQLGAYVTFTYDGIANRFSLDDTDIRYSEDAELFDKSLVYGVSFNNTPSVQDLWNTTPAWSFPYASSSLANSPGAGPVINNLGGQVGGATLYTMIADSLFLEAGAYSSFAKNMQKGLGQWDYANPNMSLNSGAVKLDGGAPYWRIALQQEWAGHYVSLGHFGFRANIQPDVTIPGTDHYTDLGMDINYQYLANTQHIYEFKASYIREQQELLASYRQSNAAQINQQLGFLALNGSYTYAQTYSFNLGYNYIYGNSDQLLYSSSPTTKPNSEFFTFELDYVPFGKTADAGLSSYMNVRFALQYIAYTRFDGAVKNYDMTMAVPRSAADNNTLYFNSWLNF